MFFLFGLVLLGGIFTPFFLSKKHPKIRQKTGFSTSCYVVFLSVLTDFPPARI